MPSLASLAPFTTAAGALGNLVLVSPQKVVGYQPQAPAGTPQSQIGDLPAKLLFHYEGEQSIDVESDITDHYVEDNTAVQDQIALRPERIKVQGYIGELNDVPFAGLDYLKTAADKLGAIDSYAPGLSATALLAYSEAFFLAQTAASLANSAVQAWNLGLNTLTGSDGNTTIGANGIKTAGAQNKQQSMFQQIYGYWSSRTLFRVQTPWCVFEDMAIENFRALQSGENNAISDFEITFKRIRVADTIEYSGASDLLLQGRASNQAADLKDLGTSAATGGGPSISNSFALFG